MPQANPFDPPQPLDSNPFADPSGRSNPFQHPNDSAISLDSGPRQQPAGQRSQRSVDLERREREVQAAEERIRRERAEIDAQANNWPPFYPLIHHDISNLPDEHRTVGKLLYFQWLALAVTLIFNLVGCVMLLVSGASAGGADMGASVMYIVVISIASFFSWYRPIYLGLSRTEGRAMAFFFYIYFLFAGFHLLFSAYMAVGIPSTGSAGLINTISSFARGSIVTGVFGVLASTGWVLQAVGGGILYKRIWDFKNGNGDITFQAAQDQFKAASIKTIILHQSRV